MSETIEAAAEAGTAENDATMTAAPASDTETATSNADEVGGEQDTEGEQPDATTPEDVEVAFGAKTLKVAKGAIPDEILAELTEFTKGINGDYTRKTQEIAETRKAIEAEREMLSLTSKLAGQKLQDFAEGQMIARTLQQLQAEYAQQGASLWQSNPDQARQMSDRISMLQAELAQKVDAVSRHEAEIKAAEQQYVAKAMEAGRAEMQKRVKGFDANAEKALTEYAASRGIPTEQANQWALNPVVAEAFWKAMQFDRQQATVKAAVAAKQAPAPAPEPVKPISGAKAQTARDPEKMSDDEWFKWRNSQLAKRRA